MPHFPTLERSVKTMKLGARTLKTGIAIAFAIYIAQLLDLPTPVFAGIAAIFAIEPTIYRSYLSILQQIQGNLIGVTIAILFVLLFGNHILFVGLAAIIVLLVTIKLKLENASRLALVSMIAIMLTPGDDFLYFAGLRTGTIFLGIFSAFIVNLFFIPPKHETRLFNSITSVSEDMIKWIRLTSRFASEDQTLKKGLGNFRDELKKCNLLFSMYREESHNFRKMDRDKLRKLVIYRQMIQTAQICFEILKLQQKNQAILHQLPERIQLHVRNRLDFLLSYHEQLLLKHMGHVRVDVELDTFNENIYSRAQLTEAFYQEMKDIEAENEFEPYHLMHILSAMINYEEQLERLDKYTRVQQKYHLVDETK